MSVLFIFYSQPPSSVPLRSRLFLCHSVDRRALGDRRPSPNLMEIIMIFAIITRSAPKCYRFFFSRVILLTAVANAAITGDNSYKESPDSTQQNVCVYFFFPPHHPLSSFTDYLRRSSHIEEISFARRCSS